MPRVLDQHFMRPHRLHRVIETDAAPRRIALYVVNRRRMDDRTSRPRTAVHRRHRRDDLGLLWRFRAIPAEWLALRASLSVVARDDPRPGNRVLAQFHNR